MKGAVPWALSGWVALALPAPARAESHTPTIAVVETYAPGMPVAGAAVTRQLYATIARIGYRAVPEAETSRLTALAGPHVLSATDLLSIARDAGAGQALQATLSANGERYVASLVLTNTTRTRPSLVSDVADPAALEATVDRLARSLLPPVASEAAEHDEKHPKSSVRLALQTEGAFGLSERFFYNQFAGARLDYGFTRDFAMGVYVGYANLKGREGRAENVLPYLQLEYRLRFSRDARFWVPLRFGSGFLPKNGPFLRLAAGPSFPLGGSTRLGLDLLAPTFVIVHDRTVVSMDVAAEVSFEL
ncbi:MAG TPA: hypothetical protein VHU80_06980 [Polyangiaceae bacterium]|jgi:hypothetical protein|nr:hypothetical protein [Polyangiaceae bacterium]